MTLDGSERLPEPEETTAGRIVAAGGSARASSASVTDGEAVRALFGELVDEHGGLDAVVNVAGITRQTLLRRGHRGGLAGGARPCTSGATSTCSSAALPLMAAAGHGRILGVTSGSGWRPADAGAYSCAKRAVAALTWQLGRLTPPGVTVNAMSPIAATRMVAAAVERARQMGGPSGGGGMSLRSMPGPEDLGPLGAHLVGDGFGWCTGQVLFAGGSEVAVVDEPRLLEVVRSDGVVSLARVLEAVIPRAFAKAETSQASDGGGNPRFGPIFDEPGPAEVASARGAVLRRRHRPPPAGGVAHRRPGGPVRGLPPRRGGPRLRRRRRGAALRRRSRRADRRRRRGARRPRSRPPRPKVGSGCSPNTAGSSSTSTPTPAWARAAADYAAGADRPVRLVTLTDATTAGGRSRAQASVQLARAAAGSTRGARHRLRGEHRGSGGGRRPDRSASSSPTCSVTPRQRRSPVRSWWSGPAGSACAVTPDRSAAITYGGPAVPDWLDATLREIVGATGHRRPRGGLMTAQPTRVVDAHVHLWDPARTDWYPYLSHPRGRRR